MAISSYNVDPALNTFIGGTNIAEGCGPEGMNDALRQVMADLAAFVATGGETAYSLRALVVPVGEAGPAIPNIATRMNKVLLFDNVGIPGVSAFTSTYSGSQALMVDHRTVMAALTGMTAGQSVVLGEAGREGVFVWSTANHSANVTLDPGQGIYVAPATATTGASGAWVRVITDRLNVLHFGAISGGGDDTAAFSRALAVATAKAASLYVPPGSFNVDKIEIPSNVRVVGAGKTLVTIQQNTGQPVNTQIVRFIGSHSSIEGVKLVGNITTDTSEFNHAVAVMPTTTTGSLTDIMIDVDVQNIRGDGVYIGPTAAAYSAGYSATGIVVRSITGDNIYRNGWSIVGGDRIRVEHWAFTQVGIYDWDIETDAASGPVGKVYIAGGSAAYVAISGSTAAAYVEHVEVGALRLNPANTGPSVPDYAATMLAALATRNVKALSIESLDVQGFNEAALSVIGGHAIDQASIDIKSLVTLDCRKAAVSNASVIENSYTGVEIRIGSWYLKTTSIYQNGFLSSRNLRVGVLTASILTGGRLFYDIDDCEVGRIIQTVNGAGAGGAMAGSARNLKIGEGSVVGSDLMTFGCTDCLVHGVEATCTTYITSPTRVTLTKCNLGGTRYELAYYTGASTPVVSITDAGVFAGSDIGATNINAASVYKVAGTQVVGARQAAIASTGSAASSATATGIEYNALLTVVNNIRAALIAHGLTAP